MADPFLGEIHIFANAFAPENYADCKGQLLDKSQNETLFALLGYMYGGKGTTKFALPDFQGRTPIGQSDNFPLTSKGGQFQVSLNNDTMPSHSHTLRGSNVDADSNEPGEKSLASSVTCYAGPDKLTTMKGVLDAYRGDGHYNIQPSFGIRYAIALQGAYPL